MGSLVDLYYYFDKSTKRINELAQLVGLGNVLNSSSLVNGVGLNGGRKVKHDQ